MNEHICGAEVELQRGYLTALLAPPTGLPAAEPGEIHDLLTCVLQAGHLGRHHGIARSLPMDCDERGLGLLGQRAAARRADRCGGLYGRRSA
jgi:hypothetical protein